MARRSKKPEESEAPKNEEGAVEDVGSVDDILDDESIDAEVEERLASGERSSGASPFVVIGRFDDGSKKNSTTGKSEAYEVGEDYSEEAAKKGTAKGETPKQHLQSLIERGLVASREDLLAEEARQAEELTILAARGLRERKVAQRMKKRELELGKPGEALESDSRRGRRGR